MALILDRHRCGIFKFESSFKNSLTPPWGFVSFRAIRNPRPCSQADIAEIPLVEGVVVFSIEPDLFVNES
jgi:hypothetical protein